jgi:hypothetical protein
MVVDIVRSLGCGPGGLTTQQRTGPSQSTAMAEDFLGHFSADKSRECGKEDVGPADYIVLG